MYNLQMVHFDSDKADDNNTMQGEKVRLVLHSYSNDNPLVLRWYSTDTPLVLQRYSTRTPAVLQRYSNFFLEYMEYRFFPLDTMPSLIGNLVDSLKSDFKLKESSIHEKQI